MVEVQGAIGREKRHPDNSILDTHLCYKSLLEIVNMGMESIHKFEDLLVIIVACCEEMKGIITGNEQQRQIREIAEKLVNKYGIEMCLIVYIIIQNNKDEQLYYHSKTATYSESDMIAPCLLRLNIKQIKEINYKVQEEVLAADAHYGAHTGEPWEALRESTYWDAMYKLGKTLLDYNEDTN